MIDTTKKSGKIMKALSGFYYVDCDGDLITCRARGKFRHKKVTPLVGDHVEITLLDDGSGALESIFPRVNEFQRPTVANMEQLVAIVSGVIPVTDPFLIDRVTAIADGKENCECIICINKCDLDTADHLYEIYTKAGFPTVRVSATTGEGITQLAELIKGKVTTFTGNSGVGKSSILNALQPEFHLQVGEVSEKLGRGRHTTRHVELHRLDNGAIVADTPGFSSFDTERMELIHRSDLEYAFREFRPFLGECQFVGCAHIKEKGCAIRNAVEDGTISRSRHDSYSRLYEQTKDIKEWERPSK